MAELRQGFGDVSLTLFSYEIVLKAGNSTKIQILESMAILHYSLKINHMNSKQP